ncbi:MAG: hypothetical protein LBU86_06180 [Oscillospiraceae bacterium]|nr:hypothetical protein [Oscillospiraceae bacterium]
MLTFTTGGDISIEVNGKRLAVAQSYRVRTDRSAIPVEALGSHEPVGHITGSCVHRLELTRVELFAGEDADFYELEDFNVVIARPGRRVIYTGCRWSGIDESAGQGGCVLETVTILAARRAVLR